MNEIKEYVVVLSNGTIINTLLSDPFQSLAGINGFKFIEGKISTGFTIQFKIDQVTYFREAKPLEKLYS